MSSTLTPVNSVGLTNNPPSSSAAEPPQAAVAPYAPFGGFGASGLGRENGADALNEYTEVKSVWVELTGATRDPFKLG